MSKSDHKSLVQHQFGRSADDYATSQVHAAGESLQVLVNLVSAQSDWSVLDVATGAGHTAIAFAPLVDHVVATDITDQMLTTTQQLAETKGVNNLETSLADAESLPFGDQCFDLVTCRLAFHHFQNQHQALTEFARVLKPGGLIGFTDNYTVDDPDAAGFYNQFETIRDPSHHIVHSLAGLNSLFRKAGFEIHDSKLMAKEFEFQKWADRQRVSNSDKEILLDMLDRTPPALQHLLKPRKESGTAYFSLAEVALVTTPKK